jgi:hypothetical protein
MTDTYPGFFGEYPSNDRVARRLQWLLAARWFLAVAGVGLVFFILQWSSAVKQEDAPRSQIHEVRSDADVVVPQYAGGGRGSTLIALKSWRFGTVEEHPIWFGSCVAILIAIGGAFAACKWYAVRLKLERAAAHDGGAESMP